MVGCDLCRVLAMLGIVCLHMIGRGMRSNDFPTYRSSAFWVLWGIEIIALNSVNLFAMLSGYLGYGKSRYRSERMLELIATVLFYSILLTVVFCILYPSVFQHKRDYVLGLVPMLFGRYWYISSYIPLFVLMPYINLFLGKLDVRTAIRLACILLMVFSVAGIFLCVWTPDIFVVKNGYSPLWLIVCYVVGCVIRKMQMQSYSRMMLLATVIIGGGILIGLKFLTLKLFHTPNGYLCEYNSPVIVAMSISLFLLCISFCHLRMECLWSGAAPSAFDVYIIHCHPFLYDYILSFLMNWVFCRFKGIMELTVILMVNIILVYLVGWLIYYVRCYVFQFLHIPDILHFLGEHIDRHWLP